MTELQTLFMERAQKASATVQSMETIGDALQYTVDLCDTKEACEILVSGCADPLSDPAEELCRTKQDKIIAAPGWNGHLYEKLTTLCEDRSITTVSSSLRDHLGGVDIALTRGDFGIAETGTVVLRCTDEDLRLATMIAEYHLVVLPKSKLVKSVHDLAGEMGSFLGAAPSFLAFLTGPSRTADIERVLTIGVHGPLELHVLLVDEETP